MRFKQEHTLAFLVPSWLEAMMLFEGVCASFDWRVDDTDSGELRIELVLPGNMSELDLTTLQLDIETALDNFQAES